MTLVTVLVALLGAAVVAGSARRPASAPWIALATSALSACAALRATFTGAVVDLPWIPSWGARITLEADALGSMLALLATGIGTLVLLYSRPYISHHLRQGKRPEREQVRYYALMLLFMGAMAGLAYARDLILLFVFFDLTALCSYFLIGFDREDAEARRAALMAVIITGSGSMLLLIAALIWAQAGGSFDVAVLRHAPIRGPAREWAALLLVLAALVKSAQVPFHFWLPRAMAAPTPVSAYLHSAAMVAAGVFLLLRLEPLLAQTHVAAALPYLGLTSIAVGSVLALGADRLKQLLAYSTIAQYGYVVLLLGLAGDAGRAGAPLYLMAHAIAKSALFLTAGAVTSATGEDRLSRLGGLMKSMPVLALASGVAAAALAGLPLTIGYFKDEVLFQAALLRGVFFAAAAVAAAGLTFAYTARFWFGTFGGVAVPVKMPRRGSALMAAPIIVLALAAAVGGALPGLLTRIGLATSATNTAPPVRLELGYGLGVPALLALGAYALGAIIHLTRRGWSRAAARVHALGARAGSEAVYTRLLAGLDSLSDRLHAGEVRDLRDRIAAILFPALVLVAAALVRHAARAEWRLGPIEAAHAPLLIGLAALALAGLAAPACRTHLPLVLALSAVGFTLSAVYALLAAPDLALVSVLVETAFTLLLLAAFGALPQRLLRREDVVEGRARVQKRRHRWAGASAGVVAFVVAWSVLSARSEGGVADTHRQWSERVHAEDAVSAILADFRGLDTAGEATVLALSLLGLFMLLGARASHNDDRAGVRPRAEEPAVTIRTLPMRLVGTLVLAASWAVALALLLKGDADTGDGFSAGLTAGMGILIYALVHGREHARRLAIVRHAATMASVGVLVVLVPVVAPLFFGSPPFTHFPTPGSEAPSLGIFSLHSGFAIELGVFALVLGFLTSVIDLLARPARAMPVDSP